MKIASKLKDQLNQGGRRVFKSLDCTKTRILKNPKILSRNSVFKLSSVKELAIVTLLAASITLRQGSMGK